jgi:hypothetical protein
MSEHIKTGEEIGLAIDKEFEEQSSEELWIKLQREKWVSLDWLEIELERLDGLIETYGCPHIQVQKLREKLRIG